MFDCEFETSRFLKIYLGGIFFFNMLRPGGGENSFFLTDLTYYIGVRSTELDYIYLTRLFYSVFI
jgi:hypothetical protein